jgi:hypothetical protein
MLDGDSSWAYPCESTALNRVGQLSSTKKLDKPKEVEPQSQWDSTKGISIKLAGNKEAYIK